MPFVPVPNTVMVEMRQRLDVQLVENTLYFKKAAAWITSDYVTLANDLLVWWTSDLATVLSSDLSLFEIYITDLTSATSPVHSQAAPTPNPTGGAATASLPNNVSLTVSFRTANRGRSFRGRNYVAGLPENVVVKNTVDAAFVAAIQASYVGLADIGIDNAAPWSVVSRYSGVDADGDPIPRVTGIATPIVSVVVVDPIVDSQRRRLPKRGL